MEPTEFAAPIVVGIDGSPTAIGAALWAADGALSGDLALRLAHVIDGNADIDRDLGEDPAFVARQWPKTRQGLDFLQAAAIAVQDTGNPLDVETQILWGDVDPTLIEESEMAAMARVGSAGIAPICQHVLGSTAAVLAEPAHSSVAVIRAPHAAPTSEPDWIVAVVDDELERRMAPWPRDDPGTCIHLVSAPTDTATFLVEHDELFVQLTVLGSAAADQTAAIVGSHRPTQSSPNRCSVLVVRGPGTVPR
jgi:nucleotide-binding universal stress UspA family protein